MTQTHDVVAAYVQEIAGKWELGELLKDENQKKHILNSVQDATEWVLLRFKCNLSITHFLRNAAQTYLRHTKTFQPLITMTARFRN